MPSKWSGCRAHRSRRPAGRTRVSPAACRCCAHHMHTAHLTNRASSLLHDCVQLFELHEHDQRFIPCFAALHRGEYRRCSISCMCLSGALVDDLAMRSWLPALRAARAAPPWAWQRRQRRAAAAAADLAPPCACVAVLVVGVQQAALGRPAGGQHGLERRRSVVCARQACRVAPSWPWVAVADAARASEGACSGLRRESIVGDVYSILSILRYFV